MDNELIELKPFDESGYNQLIAEIPDARFLLQWAGPEYTYPLDAAQLSDTLEKTTGKKPSYRVFNAIRSDTSKTVGHTQLMNIDYDSGSCVLGRVLVFKKFRGNGFGKSMVQAAITVAFGNLNLTAITLKVFDFNISAVSLYRGIGFSDFLFERRARQFQNEYWTVINMRLNKDRWLNTGNANTALHRMPKNGRL